MIVGGDFFSRGGDFFQKNEFIFLFRIKVITTRACSISMQKREKKDQAIDPSIKKKIW